MTIATRSEKLMNNEAKAISKSGLRTQRELTGENASSMASS